MGLDLEATGLIGLVKEVYNEYSKVIKIEEQN